MNAHAIKKIKKEIRRARSAAFRDAFNAMCALPLRQRIRWASDIIMRRTVKG